MTSPAGRAVEAQVTLPHRTWPQTCVASLPPPQVNLPPARCSVPIASLTAADRDARLLAAAEALAPP